MDDNHHVMSQPRRIRVSRIQWRTWSGDERGKERKILTSAMKEEEHRTHRRLNLEEQKLIEARCGEGGRTLGSKKEACPRKEIVEESVKKKLETRVVFFLSFAGKKKKEK